ncbi:MAG: AsnC family transcriptional regulator [Actinobacteria bacterium]|nr:AsnC family transcriptional regulator [Actinomycetota bacterium]
MAENNALDIQLLYALQLDGRAPFSLIGEVLGVSDQTIARRYNRLRSAGLLRVRGLIEPDLIGLTSWIIRVQCTPNAAAPVAEALARRSDTAFVSLISGGTEVTGVIRTRAGEDDTHLLLDALPRSRGVNGITAQCVLHTYFGGALSLVNKSGTLTPDQVAALQPRAAGQAPKPGRVAAEDGSLLTVLELDGRTTYSDLAAATGWSQTTVRRRIADLRASGMLYFDVDFRPSLLDITARAMVWLTVSPAQLDSTGQTMAGHPETAYVAATTGTANLYAAVLCPSTEALYTYLTGSLAQLPGLQQVETILAMRTVKLTGLLSRP